MTDGYTNIAGINFRTNSINFDKDKTFVNNGFAQVTLIDGTVFTYNEESQKMWLNTVYNGRTKNPNVFPMVDHVSERKYGDVSAPNSILTNYCNFTSVKSSSKTTFFDLFNTNIRRMDTKNGVGDMIEIESGSSVKRLYGDENDELIDRNVYDNDYKH